MDDRAPPTNSPATSETADPQGSTKRPWETPTITTLSVLDTEGGPIMLITEITSIAAQS